MDINDYHTPNPWYLNNTSVYPIASAARERIYVNRTIAQCHNVDDGIEWTVIASCEAYSKRAALDKLLTEECSYTYSIDLPFVDKMLCYLDNIISTCPYIYNDTVLNQSDTGFSNEEIKTGCIEGPHALVFFKNKPYRNVFCFMCNNNTIFNYKVDCNSKIIRGTIKELTFILDHTLMEDIAKDSSNREILLKRTYLDDTQQVCKTLEMKVKCFFKYTHN